MYWLLLLALLGLGGLLLRSGLAHSSRSRAAAGLLVLAGTLLFFALLGFWGEMLWFEAAGYAPRFWRMVAAKVLATLAGAGVGGLGAFAVSSSFAAGRRRPRRFVAALGAVVGSYLGFAGSSR